MSATHTVLVDALTHIEFTASDALQTKSRDIQDWHDDMLATRNIARAALAAAEAQLSPGDNARAHADRICAAAEAPPRPAHALPPLDQSRMLGYDAIRYVAGWPGAYIREYAAAAYEAGRQQGAPTHAAARRLINALNALDAGSDDPGFRGWQNGNGENVGDEAQEAMESLAALLSAPSAKQGESA